MDLAKSYKFENQNTGRTFSLHFCEEEIILEKPDPHFEEKDFVGFITQKAAANLLRETFDNAAWKRI